MNAVNLQILLCGDGCLVIIYKTVLTLIKIVVIFSSILFLYVTCHDK
jgi:hypothetical protein